MDRAAKQSIFILPEIQEQDEDHSSSLSAKQAEKPSLDSNQFLKLVYKEDNSSINSLSLKVEMHNFPKTQSIKHKTQMENI